MSRCLAALLLFITTAAARAAGADSPLILISLDGFRHDYCEKYPEESRTLREMRTGGASARGLVPVFPSNTFPGHYSLVTGLHPARHGIVNNDFFDTERGAFFHYFQPGSFRDGSWWGGEPIWVTAERQGRRAAAHFWAGSEAAIAGVRPTFWRPFDYTIPFARRLDEVSDWLRRPPAERPAIVAFYLEEVNGAGHRFGPASPEVAAAVRKVDGHIAEMRARLRELGLTPNFVVVSDHGMTATTVERVVVLDDILDPRTVQIDSDGSLLALRPLTGTEDELVAKFGSVPRVRAFRSADLPAHLAMKPGPRVAPVWVLPDEGWHIAPRATVERLRRKYPEKGYLAGDHGYDPNLRSMHGILIAEGPAFRSGHVIPEVSGVQVYDLLCAVMGVKPAPNDGDDRLRHELLR
jgi:predicted AlkP superfamily pyrophosphatase or phosphodiesterase